MKKIRLNVADLDATEILSREQMKSVIGGSVSGSDSLYKLPCKTSACQVEILNEYNQIIGTKSGWCTGEENHGTVKCWCDAVSKDTPLSNTRETSHCSGWN